MRITPFTSLIPLLVIAHAAAAPAAEPITLRVQTRDEATGEPRSQTIEIDPAHTGVVVVDMWNWHWCKTATQRVGAMVPRMDRSLNALRAMGVQVFMCPTDVADMYVGTPARQRALAVDITRPIPPMAAVTCPDPPSGPGCACGDVKCAGNYGWDGLAPGLTFDAERDLMPNSFASLYWLAKDRGIDTLIYVGVHTQVCLLGKSVGLKNMKAAGFRCVLARDLTDSHPDYNPARGIDPDDLTARTVAHFERYLCATINLRDELTRLGKWPDAPGSVAVDPVRVAPWGTPMRPHLFEKPVVVTLCAPWQADATIRYTTDGSAPTPRSSAYTGPITLDATTTLRAQAFAGAEPVCIETTARFAHLAAVPPKPDVYLNDATPLRSIGPGHAYEDGVFRISPGVNPPQANLTNGGQPLRLRGKVYERGMGVAAPNELTYAVDPAWRRFVGRAGVDESSLATSFGSNVAMHPSVVFRVFIDGEPAAASPVMRISFEPWRFDVPIPRGAKRITLVADDAGDGWAHDAANWVEAGFVKAE